MGSHLLSPVPHRCQCGPLVGHCRGKSCRSREDTGVVVGLWEQERQVFVGCHLAGGQQAFHR